VAYLWVSQRVCSTHHAEALRCLVLKSCLNCCVFSAEVVVPEGLNCCVNGVLIVSWSLVRVEQCVSFV